MTVFVVKHNYPYEDTWIISIWSTRELANEAAKKEADKKKHEKVGPSEYKNKYGSNIFIQEWIVDEKENKDL